MSYNESKPTRWLTVDGRRIPVYGKLSEAARRAIVRAVIKKAEENNARPK